MDLIQLAVLVTETVAIITVIKAVSTLRTLFLNKNNE